MPWIRSFRHLGLWVAFTENDYHEMSCQSFGFTRGHAESRVLRKMEARYPSVTDAPRPTLEELRALDASIDDSVEREGRITLIVGPTLDAGDDRV